MPRLTLLRTILPLIILAFTLLLGGCANPKAEAADYNALFAQHKYAESYDAASKIAGSMHAIDRDQAALVAGLSARSLDRTADAKHYLVPVATNANPSIAGQASAALGAIAYEEKRYREASRHFLHAGSKLRGDDAASAFMYAGDALRAEGRAAEAKAAFEKAGNLVTDQSTLKAEIADRLAGGGPLLNEKPGQQFPRGKYTVQTGAFSTVAKAKREAQKFAAKAATRTVPIRDRKGRTLYAVQVGRFATRAQADQFRQGVSRTAVVTTVE
ncbi:MAG TPA: SPOR domain-containing protein [Phycisphaerales bacterium]|nr:SPOR domain-containing protein [Phycisphaerales bacterium]